MAHQDKKKNARPRIAAGNWKMYKTIEEAATFVKTLASHATPSQVAVYLAVPFTAIYPVSTLVKELQAPFVIGAQNMNDASEGAFTGEIAAKMLFDAGAQFVILGHSERRHLFAETNTLINHKVKRALADGLQPMLCVGETLEDRREGKTEAVLKEQLEGSLQDIDAKGLAKIILAYEPVWAIGTGEVAHPDDAQKAHAFLRGVLVERFGRESAQAVSILYGGSVKPENTGALLEGEDVDGVLVGGASLSPEIFGEIIQEVSRL